MSDITPLNDPELQNLERRLTAVRLSPNASRREHLLYACGRAAGRAEIERRLRRMYVVAASLTCVSAALSVAVFLIHAVPPRPPAPGAEAVVERRPGEVHDDIPLRSRTEAVDEGPRHLTAGTTYEQFLTLDREQPKDGLDAARADLTSPHVLTPLGGPALEELWN
jgi:hypothetical protein